MIHNYTRKLCKSNRNYFLAFASMLSFLVSQAQPAGVPVVSFTQVAGGPSGGLETAVDIVNAGDMSNRLFVVQNAGFIKIFSGGAMLPTPFLDLRDTVLSNGEQGLLSLAFHPDYETNGYFFVWYTDKEGDCTLARYQVSAGNPNLGNQTSEVILLEIPKPLDPGPAPYYANHNGGKILFGPDGYLYVSIGDGGGADDPNNNAQNGNSLFGKMLRLNVTNQASPPYYAIPPDNPYVSDPNVRDEVWIMGLRNPWRWSFDRLTNDMWIGDVGQSQREEIDFRAAGSTGPINYGWSCFEGTLAYEAGACLPGETYTPPIFNYDRSDANGGRSVTGGMVYRGSTYPLLAGWYVMTDYITRNLWRIYPNGGGGWTVHLQPGGTGLTGTNNGITGFGEAENGEMYAVTWAGNVYQVAAVTAIPVKLKLFNGEWKDNSVLLQWNTDAEENVNRFEIQYSNSATNFVTVGTVSPTNNPNGASYTFNHTPTLPGLVYYRLAIVDNDGSVEYSRIVNLTNTNGIDKVKVYPTIVENGFITIETPDRMQSLVLTSMVGQSVLQKKMANETGRFNIDLHTVQPGTYIMQLTGAESVITRQIIIR